jgi:hypothetical protein
MGQTVAKMIRIAAGKNLRLVFQSPERPGMDHAITIALEVRAIGVSGLRISTSPTFFLRESVSSHC